MSSAGRGRSASEERGRERSRSAGGHGRKSRSKSGSRSKSRSKSKSRSRSRSKGRGRKRSKSPKKKNKKKDKKKGKKKGKDVGEQPVSQWSKELLMDRCRLFSKFETNRNTGSGSLTVNNTRLMGETLEIVLEVLTRFVEVQHVTFRKCFVTDEILEEMIEVLHGLQHLKTLALPYNALTSAAIKPICTAFFNKKRKLEVLDLRENQLDEHDGEELYKTYKGILLELNGVPIKPFKNDMSKTKLDLKLHQLKLPEMAVICGLLKECINIREVDMSNNYFDASAARLLAATIPFSPGLRVVDISKNPLTNKGKDEDGVLQIVDSVVRLDKITSMNIRDCGADDELVTKVERSASVNRSVHATKSSTNSYFTDFIRSRIDTGKLSESPSDPYTDYEPPFEMDLDFTKFQRLNLMQVEMRTNEIKLNRKKMGPHGHGMKF